MGWHTEWKVDVRKHGAKNLVDAANIVWREIPRRPYRYSAGIEGYKARVGSRPYLEVDVQGDPNRKERDIYLRIPMKKRDYPSLKQFLETILTLEPKLCEKIISECPVPIDMHGKYRFTDQFHRTVSITTSLTKVNKEEIIRRGRLSSGEVVYERNKKIPLDSVSEIVDELFSFPFVELNDQRIMLLKRPKEEITKWYTEYEVEYSTISLETKKESSISYVNIDQRSLFYLFTKLSIELPSYTTETYELFKMDLEKLLNLLSKIDMQSHWFDIWRVGWDKDFDRFLDPFFALLYYLSKPFDKLSGKEKEPYEMTEEVQEEKEEILVKVK